MSKDDILSGLSLPHETNTPVDPEIREQLNDICGELKKATKKFKKARESGKKGKKHKKKIKNWRKNC